MSKRKKKERLQPAATPEPRTDAPQTRAGRRTRLLITFGTALGIAVGFAANALGAASGARSAWESLAGRDDQNLIVLKARLVPWLSTVADPRQRNQVFLQTVIRNTGASPVYLTAADVQLVNARYGGRGVAGGAGNCRLTPDVVENTPMELLPGQARWITFSPALRLPGLENFLNGELVARLTPFPAHMPVTFDELEYTDSITAELLRRYGADATLRVDLFTGNKSRIRRLEIPLRHGGDLFSSADTLQYDALVAAWKSRNWNVLWPGGRDCDESTPEPAAN